MYSTILSSELSAIRRMEKFRQKTKKARLQIMKSDYNDFFVLHMTKSNP